MSKLPSLRTSLAVTQSGAPVTSASWLVWVVAAVIMTPIALLARAVEPQPTWWSVVALGIGAAVSTYSGYHAGRMLEARSAGRAGSGDGLDLRSVREAAQVAALVTAMVAGYTSTQVATSGLRIVVVVLVFGGAAAWIAVRHVRQSRAATERRASRGAAR